MNIFGYYVKVDESQIPIEIKTALENVLTFDVSVTKQSDTMWLIHSLEPSIIDNVEVQIYKECAAGRLCYVWTIVLEDEISGEEIISISDTSLEYVIKNTIGVLKDYMNSKDDSVI